MPAGVADRTTSPSSTKRTEQLDADLEPDAAVPVERDVTAGRGLLRLHRLPDDPAALRHEPRQIALARLALDHGQRHARHFLDLDDG